MDQKKIGSFLKELRNEKNVTQEQLAEVLNVSGRTVSRWETGSNMPDISILVDIADYYDVSISEIINGERKSEIMNKEEREIAKSMSDYATAEKETIFKKMKMLSITGICAVGIYLFLHETGIYASSELLGRITGYFEALIFVVVILMAVFSIGSLGELRRKSMRIFLYDNVPAPYRQILIVVTFIVVPIVLKYLLIFLFGTY